MEKCPYCDATDDAKHTFFYCLGWDRESKALRLKLGREVNETNIIDCMLESEENWEIVKQYITYILKNKVDR